MANVTPILVLAGNNYNSFER